MRHRLRSYSLTPTGGTLLLVLVAAVVVLLVGPKHDEVPAFIVIAIVLGMFALGGNPTGTTRSRWRSLSERREEFHPRQRDWSNEDGDSSDNEELWQRERERYRQKDQGP